MIKLGTLAELEGVLMMLLAGLGKLVGQFAGGALRPKESNEQDGRGGQQREITK